MATVPIRDILDNETGEPIFPRTHVKAVIGLADSNFFEEYVDGNGARSVKLRSDYVGLWAEGWIAAGGVGTGGGGGGGLITSVKGVADLGTPIATESLTETFSAYAIQSIYNSVRLKSAVALSNVLPYASGRVRVATLTIDGTNHDIYAPEPTGGGGVETETDPIFSASAAFGISTTDIANWNAKVSNIQADWNATTGLAAILNRPSLSAVATSGSYNDLSNKPSIPNEATVSGWGFTKNTGTVTRVAMTVPTGLSVSGSPITASGTLAISFANGYSIPTTSKQSGWDAKYDKPSGGIPKTDLASAVQTSLGKADTALQSETDPTVPAWAKSATKPSYAFSELTSHPTTISGYGITDAKFGTPGTDNVPITIGSTTKSVLTDHQDLTPLTNRLSAIEDWFEVVNVGTAESPNYALHAKQGRAIYSDSWIAAGGVGSGSSSSGGLITRVRSITDLGTAIATESLTETFSAKAIEGIYEEVRNLTGSGLATQTWVNSQGFLKTETDPTVPAWAKAESKPSYSLSEISGTEDLRAIESLTGTGLLKRTGANAWSLDSTTYLASGTTLDDIADGSTRKLSNYLPLSGGTMTGAITMSSANIYPSASHTCNLGASAAFFMGVYGDTVHAHALELYSSGSVQAFRLQGGIENPGATNEVYYALLTLHQGTGEGVYITKDTMFGMGTAKDLGKTYARWKGIYGASADLTGNLDLGGVLRVNSLNTIDQSNASMSLFNHGARATKSFNAYGTGINFRACDSNGAQVNILAINATKIQAGSDLIPNYTAGLNLGGSSSTTRWATIYGVDANLSGDLSMTQSSHIDIGPLRIEYDAANKALHITKKDNSDTNTYGLYADGFVASGGVGQTS